MDVTAGPSITQGDRDVLDAGVCSVNRVNGVGVMCLLREARQWQTSLGGQTMLTWRTW